jgi:arylsulfatase A-like enzyme
MITGTLQACIQAFRQFILGEFTWTTPYFLWMTPIAYIPFFLGIGMVAWLLIRLRRRSGWHGPLFILFWLALLCLSMLWPRLSNFARVLLTLGLAWEMARRTAPRLERITPGLHAMAGMIGVLVILGAIVPPALVRRAEENWLATHPPPVAPNVLLVILDTVRGISTSLHGQERLTTPGLQALAGEGVQFERALAPSSWTLPSHASLLTGHLPHDLSANHLVPLDGEHPTLAELFRDRGFATGAVTANLHYTGRQAGLARGFLHYDDAEHGLEQVLSHAMVRQSILGRQLRRAIVETRSPGSVLAALLGFRWELPGRFLLYQRRWAPDVTEAVLDWIDSLDGRPFFAMLNYFDAHDPYEPPEPYHSQFDSAGVSRPVDRYEGAIRFLDENVTALAESLRTRGLLDNTILVVMSDHGEQFGEHDLYFHGNSLYPQLIHVPLLIRYPAKIPAGSRVTTPVSLCDVGASVLELAGDARPFGTCPSILPLIGDPGARRPSPPIFELLPEGPGSGKDGDYTRGIADDSLYYLRMPDGRERLYRHRIDLEAMTDVAAVEQGNVARLRTKVDSLGRWR